ncbi:MAG: hypothetical protein H7306_19535 [Bacteriovorax sp.]|nr:hypothetical protein [Rhizobacter sp.]
MHSNEAEPQDKYRGFILTVNASGSDGYWSAEYFVMRSRSAGKSNITVLSGKVADIKFSSDRAAMDEAFTAPQREQRSTCCLRRKTATT